MSNPTQFTYCGQGGTPHQPQWFIAPQGQPGYVAQQPGVPAYPACNPQHGGPQPGHDRFHNPHLPFPAPVPHQQPHHPSGPPPPPIPRMRQAPSPVPAQPQKQQQQQPQPQQRVSTQRIYQQAPRMGNAVQHIPSRQARVPQPQYTSPPTHQPGAAPPVSAPRQGPAPQIAPSALRSKSPLAGLKTEETLQIRPPGDKVQRVQSMREKLDEIIADPKSLQKAATLAFSSHDTNRDQMLQRAEVECLISALSTKFEVPEPDSGLVEFLFSRYDLECRDEIPSNVFLDFYKDLLFYIRERYYPDKLRFRRGSFIQKKDVSMHQYWEMTEKIGQGQFGVVYRVREKHHPSSQTPKSLDRCCKIISKEKLSCPPEYIANEINILRRLDHPNIMRLVEAYEDYQNIYLVFELIKGEELLDVIMDLAKKQERLTEDRVRNIMSSILSALSHCHSYRVMHKDLKPENIMICRKGGSGSSAASDDPHEDEFVKIIDFGLAEMFTPGRASNIVAGTPYYMAPEVFDQHFNYKCDVWSCGVLMYLMLTAHLPFDAPNKPAFIEVIKKKTVAFPANLFSSVSKEAQDLISIMLSKNVAKRPTAAQALTHPFFTSAQNAAEQTDSGQDAYMRNRRRRKTLQSFSRQGSIYQLYAERDCFARIVLNLAAMTADYSAIRDAPEVFKALDRNNDGTISEEEMEKGLEEIGCPKEYIPRILEALDSDGSGCISYSEFVAALVDTSTEAFQQQLWSVFRKFDLDHDGVISREELKKLLTTNNQMTAQQDDDTVRQLMAKLDQDGDGRITFPEFKLYMQRQFATDKRHKEQQNALRGQLDALLQAGPQAHPQY